jgi:hypothetical protein
MIYTEKVILFLIISLFVSKCTFSQNCNWLIDSSAEHKMNSDFIILTNKMKDNQLFVLGEQHKHIEDIEIDWIVFKNLRKKFKKVDLIVEAPLSYTILLNDYLSKNDTTILKLKNQIPCLAQENIKRLKTVYDTSTYRFKVIGVDIDYGFTKFTQLALRHLCHKSEIKSFDNLKYSSDFSYLLFIVGVEDDLDKINFCSRKRLYKASKKIMLEKQDDYRIFFGENYGNFYRVLQDLCIGYKERKNIVGEVRENLIFERVKNLLLSNSDRKYFAVYGNAHVNKNSTKGHQFTSFSKQLFDEGFKVFTGYRFYTYYEIVDDMKLKNFLWYMSISFGIEDIERSNLLKDYFYKKENYVIEPYELEIDDVDFVLFLNKPLIYMEK